MMNHTHPLAWSSKQCFVPVVHISHQLTFSIVLGIKVHHRLKLFGFALLSVLRLEKVQLVFGFSSSAMIPMVTCFLWFLCCFLAAALTRLASCCSASWFSLIFSCFILWIASIRTDLFL